MTTPLVQSITDEMVAELEALCKNCIADNCADEDEQNRNETQFLLGINHEDVLALLAERKELVRDRERLDSLDKLCEAYGFEVHEGNRWVIDGPFISVRDAIDSLPDDAAIDAARGEV